MRIDTVREFITSLRNGPFTSVGSYPVYWLTADGATLSYAACKANCGQIARAIRDAKLGRWSDKQWLVVGSDVNWEDNTMTCDDTGERIESAYAG